MNDATHGGAMGDEEAKTAAAEPPIPSFGPATRENALALAHDFADRMGEQYARNRGFDLGPEDRQNVSRLSPFLRRRLVLEPEVVAMALDAHGPDAAGKFVQEVVWRTYWKGWLEQRPGVWRDYLAELEEERTKLERFRDARAAHEAAVEGRTGNEAFDHWAQELIEHGYLHNHARMWFASIWIFTLKLPWVLGADFFHRHLLDGDPASNTLSWRWVAGRQTAGKTYLVTTSNIETFTKGRFRLAPGTLAETAEIADHRDPEDATSVELPAKPAHVPSLLLVSEDDCSPELLDWPPLAGIALVPTRPHQGGAGASEGVQAFEREALEDVRRRLADRADHVRIIEPDAVPDFARDMGAQQIVGPYIPVGTAADVLREPLALAGLPYRTRLREWDSRFWPHATRGYFKLKKQIPKVLKAMPLPEVA